MRARRTKKERVTESKQYKKFKVHAKRQEYTSTLPKDINELIGLFELYRIQAANQGYEYEYEKLEIINPLDLCHRYPVKGVDNCVGTLTPSNLVLAPSSLNKHLGNKIGLSGAHIKISSTTNKKMPRDFDKWFFDRYRGWSVLLTTEYKKGKLLTYTTTKQQSDFRRDAKPYGETLKSEQKRLNIESTGLSVENAFIELLTGADMSATLNTITNKPTTISLVANQLKNKKLKSFLQNVQDSLAFDVLVDIEYKLTGSITDPCFIRVGTYKKGGNAKTTDIFRELYGNATLIHASEIFFTEAFGASEACRLLLLDILKNQGADFNWEAE